MEGRRHPRRARRARGLRRPARHRADHPQAPARRLPALRVPRSSTASATSSSSASDMVATIAELLAPARGQGRPAPARPARARPRGAPPPPRQRSPKRAPGARGAPTTSSSSPAPRTAPPPSSSSSARCDGFVELHGDRLYADDPAIVAGHRLEGRPRASPSIAIERGSSTKERVRRNFGMAHPEGYRKAQRLMRPRPRSSAAPCSASSTPPAPTAASAPRSAARARPSPPASWR